MKVLKREFIGAEVEIIESKDKNYEGIRGKVVDETKNMFVVETKDGEKKILKKKAVFMFTFPDGKYKIDGSLLVGRPEDRIKKKIPKKRV